MTKDTYRKWLDSLKPGDEVAVLDRGQLRRIVPVISRTKREIRTEGRMYSARTGKALSDWAWPGLADPFSIAQPTPEHRDRVELMLIRKKVYDALLNGVRPATLHAMWLLTDWQHRESVATHVIELIHNLTREDLPQCPTH